MNENKITCPDLRIGNWVLDCQNGFPMQVELIGKDYVYLNFEGNEGDVIECDVKDIAPIPLTEDLLVKCGFPVIYGYASNSYLTNISNSLSCLFSDNTFSIYIEWGEDLLVEANSLHQLQNIYYALTGNDLEVKI